MEKYKSKSLPAVKGMSGLEFEHWILSLAECLAGLFESQVNEQLEERGALKVRTPQIILQ
jgi:hypothetical protein